LSRKEGERGECVGCLFGVRRGGEGLVLRFFPLKKKKKEDGFKAERRKEGQ